MKIYFAGSIRGGRDDIGYYHSIIALLREFGEVLTEHVGNPEFDNEAEMEEHDQFIFNRDINWLMQAECLVAEVTQPSLGVGYEIGKADQLGKKVICLFRKKSAQKLSAMIAGNPALKIIYYEKTEELISTLKEAIVS